MKRTVGDVPEVVVQVVQHYPLTLIVLVVHQLRRLSELPVRAAIEAINVMIVMRAYTSDDARGASGRRRRANGHAPVLGVRVTL